VAVPDELPGLGVRRRKTEANQDVVQPPFELREKVLARNAFLTHCLFEICPELVLQHAINAFHLLLFSQLKSISNDLGSAVAAMLSRGEVSLFDSA